MNKALQWLEDLPRYSVLKYNLWRFYRLLSHYGVDYRTIPVFIITGSNGKGTAAVTLAGILGVAGYKIGLLTSPHLHRITERINCGGQDIDAEVLAGLLEEIRTKLPSLDPAYGTWIHAEIISLAAILHFLRCGADILVLEAGLGGRLDPVNIFPRPLAVGITSVTLEHQGILGDTVAEIAAEKAGCIKPRCPLVTGAEGDGLAVIENRARLLDAPISRWNQEYVWNSELKLPGRVFYQDREYVSNADCRNRALAGCMAALAFPDLPDASFAELEKHSLPGRFQVLPGSPLLVFDVAHNAEAISNLLASLTAKFGAARIGFVFGALSDKPVSRMLELLSGFGPVWFVPVADRRGVMPAGSPGVVAVDTVAEGIALARRAGLDILCVTGSFSVVREAYPLL